MFWMARQYTRKVNPHGGVTYISLLHRIISPYSIVLTKVKQAVAMTEEEVNGDKGEVSGVSGVSGDKGGEMMERRVRRRKPGIVYLSSIPPNMNVARIREYFGKFGELGNVYLQVTDSGKYSRYKCIN